MYLYMKIKNASEMMRLPAASQLLGAGFAGTIEKLLQISRVVHVERDAGKLQHLASFSCGLSGGEVRPETIVAETQRKKACG